MSFKALLALARSHPIPTALALVVLAAIPWEMPRLLHGPAVEVNVVQRHDIVQSVVASGHVETPHRVSIGAQIVGTVRRVRVAEGQTVEAGQVLIELDNAELQASAQQADMAVEEAQARLRQLKEVQAPVAEQALRQAEVTHRNAQTQLARNADLHKQGFIGQSALDEAQKALDLADAQWRSAQKQYATVQPHGSDYALAITTLAQSQASASAAASRLRYATIIAPVAGTLIDRAVEPGDVVQPGKTLLVLSPAGETQLVVQIDEKNLRLLAMGQDAQASADAYADQRFSARLVYINPGVDVQRGSVEVKLAVPKPPDYLTQDMTVSVDIQVAARKDAVLVRTDDVRDIGTPSPWVLTVDGSKARRRSVRLGLRSGGQCEVLEGLEAGDRVVPVTGNSVRDGTRLRPIVPAGPHAT
jgi:HlyD family secretion protein